MRAGNIAVCFVIVLGLDAVPALARQDAIQPAVPVEPVAAVLEAFRSHDIVALGDPHGNEQAHAFRLALIRDPRFAATVNDIVVEWGNALYQGVVDRFVRGDDVSDAELRLVWENTTQPGPGNDRPITEEFFRVVREVNASLSGERRLRVLLGDPPIDWDDVESPPDHRKWIDLRDIFPAALIQREVLDKQRRALVVYGVMHLQRQNLLSNYELIDDPRVQTVVQQLEIAGAPRVFTVWMNTRVALQTLQPDVASWPMPSLALIPGTTLGVADFEFYYPSETPRATLQDGRVVPIPREQWRSLAMEDQVDAVLYLGPPSAMTTSRVSPTLCQDAAYMEMRRERLTLLRYLGEIEQLEQHCARVAPR